MAVIYRAKTGTYEAAPETTSEFAARQRAKLKARRSGDESTAQQLQSTTVTKLQLQSIQEQQDRREADAQLAYEQQVAYSKDQQAKQQETQPRPVDTTSYFEISGASPYVTMPITSGIYSGYNPPAKQKEDIGFESPYTAPFLSFEGQKQRLRNVGEVYTGVAKRTVTGAYNLLVSEKYELPQDRIIVNREFRGSSSKAVKAAGYTAEFIGGRPFTSATLLVAPRYATLKGVKIGVTGGAIAGGVGVGGEYIARSQAKDFTSIPEYKSIYETGEEAAARNVAKYNLAYEISPVFSSRETKKVYQETVKEELKSRGYSEAEASRLSVQAYKYRQTRGVAEGTQQLIIGATAEGIGRAGYSAKGIGGIQPAGFYEGFVGSVVQQRQRSPTQPTDYGQAATIGAVGGVTATTASYAIITSRGGTQKFFETTGNVLDPSEYPSDKLFDLTEAATRRSSKISKTVVLTPTTTPTQTSIKTTSKEFVQAKSSSDSFFTQEFKGFKAQGYTLTQTKTPSQTKTKNLVSVSTPAFIQTKPFTQSQTETKAETLTDTQTDTIIKSDVPVSVKPETFVKSKPFSKSQTTTKTNVPVSVRSTVPVSTAVFTPNAVLFPPFRPSGGVGRGFGGRSKKVKQSKTYVPSGFAAGFGIKAGKGRKAAEFTGLGVRGIVDIPKRKKRRNIALY